MIKKINSNWYCNLLNLLKLSILLKLDYIIITYCKKLIPVLNFLLKINYISNYKIINENKIIIYFFKNQKWKNLKIMYRSSNFFLLDISNLKRFFLYDYKRTICLMTSKGLLTHNQAIDLNIGGKVLFYVF